MAGTEAVLVHGSYAYRVWALTSRGRPNRYEAWYEIWRPGQDRELLGRTALFDPNQPLPHLFPTEAAARDAARVEATWRIDHMFTDRPTPFSTAPWRRTWCTRGHSVHGN